MLTMNKHECAGGTCSLAPARHLIPLLCIWLDAWDSLELGAVTFWVFYESA